ncbi:MAG: hypothetical protein ACFCGT_25935 [Sandaracinaceae bacterium]
MFLMISRKPRKKNRGRTNRLRAKQAAKQRRRMNRAKSRPVGRRIPKAGR